MGLGLVPRTYMQLSIICNSRSKESPTLLWPPPYVQCYFCMFTVCAFTQGGQKRASDSLELELKIVVSRHVGVPCGCLEVIVTS